MDSLSAYCTRQVSSSAGAFESVSRPAERYNQGQHRGSQDPPALVKLLPAIVRLTTLQSEAGEPALIQSLAPAAWSAL
jgi:hypothetical protein